MLHLRNMKLKYQLIFLIGIGIIMMILVQALYYWRFYYIVEDKAEVYGLNTINQVNDKLNLTAASIKNASETASYNSTIQEYLGTHDLISKKDLQTSALDVLESILKSNPFIADIALIDNEENIFTKYSVFDQALYNEIKAKYNLEAMSQAGYTPLIKVDNGEYAEEFFCYINPIFNVSYKDGHKKKLGECIVLCSKLYLQNIVENTSITENSIFMLIDCENKIVVANNMGMLEDDFANNIWNFDQEQVKMPYNGNMSLITMKVNQDMAWKTISIIPINELTSDLESVKRLGIIIGIIAVALMILIGLFFSNSITRPIDHIVKKMREIGDNNIKQRILLKETNEIGIIAKNLNQMLDKVEDMTGNILRMQAKLYESELSKKEAELLALQSQINPHFLYNTLECIRSIGLANGIIEIVNISTSMAKIFRYCIKRGNFTTVNEEIESICDYLNIMSIRYEGKFNINIDIEDALLDVQMIKMILQPIVENALYHGLEPKDDIGTLIIKGINKGEKIRFEIIDDGIGMSGKDVKIINNRFTSKGELGEDLNTNKRSIGLTNINKRIKHYYGEEYGIYLESKENEGTTVIVEFPFISDNHGVHNNT